MREIEVGNIVKVYGLITDIYNFQDYLYFVDGQKAIVRQITITGALYLRIIGHSEKASLFKAHPKQCRKLVKMKPCRCKDDRNYVNCWFTTQHGSVRCTRCKGTGKVKV